MNDLSVIEREFGDLARYSQCPDFWLAKPDTGGPFIDMLHEAKVVRIGSSAGGREIIAIEYGAKEETGATMSNLASALAASVGGPDPTRIYPEVFYGSKRREKPALVFQGAIHGGELTGTVACLNLCRVIETGIDLRGKAWPELQELARATRIAIVPWLNVDGATRWPIPNCSGASGELYQRCTQGVARDGTKYRYPEDKRIFPIPPETTAFMGSYYNDAGANLQYDFCLAQRQPETLAWMQYYLDERPDAVVVWHCNAGSMIGPPEALLPAGFQHECSRLAGAVQSRLLREGLAIGRLSWSGLPGMGAAYLNQVNAIYHVCGAFPIMCELPAGSEPAPFTCEQLLDIGLLTVEEILRYAHHDGLRPYEFRKKIMAQRTADR